MTYLEFIAELQSLQTLRDDALAAYNTALNNYNTFYVNNMGIQPGELSDAKWTELQAFIPNTLGNDTPMPEVSTIVSLIVVA